MFVNNFYLSFKIVIFNVLKLCLNLLFESNKY